MAEVFRPTPTAGGALLLTREVGLAQRGGVELVHRVVQPPGPGSRVDRRHRLRAKFSLFFNAFLQPDHRLGSHSGPYPHHLRRHPHRPRRPEHLLRRQGGGVSNRHRGGGGASSASCSSSSSSSSFPLITPRRRLCSPSSSTRPATTTPSTSLHDQSAPRPSTPSPGDDALGDGDRGCATQRSPGPRGSCSPSGCCRSSPGSRPGRDHLRHHQQLHLGCSHRRPGCKFVQILDHRPCHRAATEASGCWWWPWWRRPTAAWRRSRRTPGMIYAFSADAIPGSKFWHHINPAYWTPSRSIYFAVVFAFILAILSLWSSVAYGAGHLDRGHRPLHRVRDPDAAAATGR